MAVVSGTVCMLAGAARLVGPAGHDQQHRFEVLEPLTSPSEARMANGNGFIKRSTKESVGT
jgi:hypothetical protein